MHSSGWILVGFCVYGLKLPSIVESRLGEAEPIGGQVERVEATRVDCTPDPGLTRCAALNTAGTEPQSEGRSNFHS
jgi:hypothetical protein